MAVWMRDVSSVLSRLSIAPVRVLMASAAGWARSEPSTSSETPESMVAVTMLPLFPLSSTMVLLSSGWMVRVMSCDVVPPRSSVMVTMKESLPLKLAFGV